VKIDTDRSLLYIRGGVAGPTQGLVRVRDAVKRIENQVWDLLYPTFIANQNAEGIQAQKYQVWDGGEQDPYEWDLHENDVVSGAPGNED
jgi:hypothetical protein